MAAADHGNAQARRFVALDPPTGVGDDEQFAARVFRKTLPAVDRLGHIAREETPIDDRFESLIWELGPSNPGDAGQWSDWSREHRHLFRQAVRRLGGRRAAALLLPGSQPGLRWFLARPVDGFLQHTRKLPADAVIEMLATAGSYGTLRTITVTPRFWARSVLSSARGRGDALGLLRASDDLLKESSRLVRLAIAAAARLHDAGNQSPLQRFCVEGLPDVEQVLQRAGELVRELEPDSADLKTLEWRVLRLTPDDIGKWANRALTLGGMGRSMAAQAKEQSQIALLKRRDATALTSKPTPLGTASGRERPGAEPPWTELDADTPGWLMSHVEPVHWRRNAARVLADRDPERSALTQLVAGDGWLADEVLDRAAGQPWSAAVLSARMHRHHQDIWEALEWALRAWEAHGADLRDDVGAVVARWSSLPQPTDNSWMRPAGQGIAQASRLIERGVDVAAALSDSTVSGERAMLLGLWRALTVLPFEPIRSDTTPRPFRLEAPTPSEFGGPFTVLARALGKVGCGAVVLESFDSPPDAQGAEDADDPERSDALRMALFRHIVGLVSDERALADAPEGQFWVTVTTVAERSPHSAAETIERWVSDHDDPEDRRWWTAIGELGRLAPVRALSALEHCWEQPPSVRHDLLTFVLNTADDHGTPAWRLLATWTASIEPLQARANVKRTPSPSASID